METRLEPPVDLCRYEVRQCRGFPVLFATTARLEQLLRQGGNTVRLAAQNRRSRTGTRIRRSVSTRIGGHWVDVQQELVSEGLALWLPNSVEYAWNRSYSILAQRAAASGVGLWNRSSCRAGPGDENQLRLWVDWDANGDDSRNVNGEWVKIKNADPARAISLAQWWFRDSDLRRYSFPSWALDSGRRDDHPAHRARHESRTHPLLGSAAAGLREHDRRPRARWATAATCSTPRATCAPG